MAPDSANLNVMASTTLSFAATPTNAHRLADAEKTEVLEFLSRRPLHTFVMSGFIRDHGLDSELNRGDFYGYRDASGALAGVALIGHALYIETRSDAAAKELARVAQMFPRAHVILAEQSVAEAFWRYYADGGQPARQRCTDLLFEAPQTTIEASPVNDLRPATLDDLDLVVPVHAALALAESGVDPLVVDAAGFRQRCRRRIERGRVWVRVERGELIFKADIISDTPDVIYIEGLYVDPNHRGQGHGSRCVSQMCRQLSSRTKSIAVLVDERKVEACRFFEQLGFAQHLRYQTLFLQEKPKQQALNATC